MILKKYIIITGATGWIGRNFLHELQKIFPSEIFNNYIIAFGSKIGKIKSTAYPQKQTIEIPIYPLSSIKNFIKKGEDYLFIHTAFLTREKVNSTYIKEYIKMNRQINSYLKIAISKVSNPKCIYISSGAATVFENKKNNEKKIDLDPYGFLKLKEEKILSKISTCLVLRVYALSGKFIRDPNIFAFGNFILRAIENQPIEIKAKHPVIRSYASASDISKYGINWLFFSDDYQNNIVHTSTENISLHKLALLITEIYKLPPLISNINTNNKTDAYICDKNKFIKLLIKKSIKPKFINEQIKETFQYLKNLNKS